MKWFVSFFAVVCCLALSAAEPVRTWTDLKGRSMEASFIKFVGDNIIIRRPDGTTFNVHPDIFSNKDRKYLDELRKKWAFEITLGKPFTILDLTMEMLWCAPGTFTMGSPLSEKLRNDDETQHMVTLTKGFWLGKHEVTQAQWESIMGSNPSRFKGANLPVETVSWGAAVSFCAKLTERERKAGRLPKGYAYQLPTEAQWEYACRAGTKTAFAFVFGGSLSSLQANFNGNQPYDGAAKGPYFKRTVAVGFYKANAWDFHDMHGNVHEWCHDWYGDYLPKLTIAERIKEAEERLEILRKGAQNVKGGQGGQGGQGRTRLEKQLPALGQLDPEGPAVGSDRVIRGGGMRSKGQLLRSAVRDRLKPNQRNIETGFRPSLRLDQGKAK